MNVVKEIMQNNGEYYPVQNSDRIPLLYRVTSKDFVPLVCLGKRERIGLGDRRWTIIQLLGNISLEERLNSLGIRNSLFLSYVSYIIGTSKKTSSRIALHDEEILALYDIWRRRMRKDSNFNLTVFNDYRTSGNRGVFASSVTSAMSFDNNLRSVRPRLLSESKQIDKVLKLIGYSSRLEDTFRPYIITYGKGTLSILSRSDHRRSRSYGTSIEHDMLDINNVADTSETIVLFSLVVKRESVEELAAMDIQNIPDKWFEDNIFFLVDERFFSSLKQMKTGHVGAFLSIYRKLFDGNIGVIPMPDIFYFLTQPEESKRIYSSESEAIMQMREYSSLICEQLT